MPETSSELLIPGSITGALRELSMGSDPKATPKSATLAGRYVLVVGAGQQSYGQEDPPVGIGRALALLGARQGAALAVATARGGLDGLAMNTSVAGG